MRATQLHFNSKGFLSQKLLRSLQFVNSGLSRVIFGGYLLSSPAGLDVFENEPSGKDGPCDQSRVSDQGHSPPCVQP